MIEYARSTFRVDALGSTGILHVIGDVDVRNAGALQKAVNTLAAKYAGDIYIAFGECLFIDDAALRTLCRCCESIGPRLRIVAPRTAFIRALLTKTPARGMNVYDGFEEAFLACRPTLNAAGHEHAARPTVGA